LYSHAQKQERDYPKATAMNPGQRLILGVKEPYLSQSTKYLLKQKDVGGIILFDRNAENRDQLIDFIAEIKAICPVPPFIAIDFEGGRVRRLNKYFSHLGEPSEYRDNLIILENHCREIGRQFKEIGINLNLAPVVDLSYSPLNPALVGRTFSDDPSLAAEYCAGFYNSFAANGIQCCLKHFPGLGSAVNDPHANIAVSCISKERLDANDLVPFKAGAKMGINFLMTTHLIMSEIDKNISTFSKNTIDLARLIGFDKIIVTDDMSMGAIKSKSLPESVFSALVAGHDLALVCHDNDKHEEIVEYLERNLDTLKAHGHDLALERISNVKKELS
jgi:beta-N-acetylhexosaminidase